MDLRNLVLRGFSTARLCDGGDEKAQDPKWLGAKAQGVLLDRMRKLAIECESVDRDETLSDMGKAKKRAELGQAALAEIEGSVATIRNTLGSKLATAKGRLAQAGRPPGQSDIDRLARLLEVQGARQLLLSLSGQELLGELIRSTREGDSVTFEAIVGLPVFVLRDKGLASETISAARREMLGRLDPSAVAEAESAELMSQLVDESLEQSQRAIRDFCGLPEQRTIQVL